MSQGSGSCAVDAAAARQLASTPSSPWLLLDCSDGDDNSSAADDACVSPLASYTVVDKSFICQILTLQHTQMEMLRRLREQVQQLALAVSQVTSLQTMVIKKVTKKKVVVDFIVDLTCCARWLPRRGSDPRKP